MGGRNILSVALWATNNRIESWATGAQIQGGKFMTSYIKEFFSLMKDMELANVAMYYVCTKIRGRQKCSRRPGGAKKNGTNVPMAFCVCLVEPRELMGDIGQYRHACVETQTPLDEEDDTTHCTANAKNRQKVPSLRCLSLSSDLA